MIHFPKLNVLAQTLARLKPSQNPRFHSTKKPSQPHPRKTTIKEAQTALLEYLHSTRNLQFLDADNMCKNSPSFLHNLLAKTHSQRSLSRYLRYHPINEFEPFFESAGLSPPEYAPLLPRDMIYLNDDVLLMHNYHTLCNYGVPRSKMGKIFKFAPQVFRYASGVLISKLRAYEELGVPPATLVSVAVSSPCVLVGDADVRFVRVVEKLKGLVASDYDWSEWLRLNEGCCDWSLVLRILCLLDEVCGEEELGKVIVRSPCVVFEESGAAALSVIAFLVKFGFSVEEVSLVFLEFPQIRVAKFLSNLRRSLLFLSEIEMEAAEIGRIFMSHSMLLGSNTMKKAVSLLCSLNVGKERLCNIIRENPLEMEKWCLGRKIEPLGKIESDSRMFKKEFLLSLGYVQNSKEMERVIKLFRGKGAELQERFDFIVKASGLDSKDVRKMIRGSPRILNQTIDRIGAKIEFLVNEGYPISSLLSFPSYLSYGPERVKLRFSMYNWLKDRGVAEAGLALSTIIACSEKAFVQLYVNRHPSGVQVWQDLKTKFYSKDD